MSIFVVDSVMGTGKSSAAINMINSSDLSARYIYVAPYLNEGQRIMRACPSHEFFEPEERATKSQDIKRLLAQGRNIVTTHALFERFDDEAIGLIYDKGYVLIMDEAPNVIRRHEVTPSDFETIFEKHAEVDTATKFIKWHDEKYRGKYDEYRELSSLGSLAVSSGGTMLWICPINIFTAFKDVYILTYLFNSQIQKYYFDFFEIEYTHLGIAGDCVENFHFSSQKTSFPDYDFVSLIRILENEKLNQMGDGVTSLSKNWYARNSQAPSGLSTVKNNCSNFFWHYANTPSKYNLWTTFSDWRKDIAGNGYSRGFVAQNMRASNDYRHKTSVAYLVNRFFTPAIKNFFIGHGVSVNEEEWALSEMLQLIWRSAIRDGKEINVYVPSSRMRRLLKKWIAEASKSTN